MVHNPGGDWHPGWGVDLSSLSTTRTPCENLAESNAVDGVPFCVSIPYTDYSIQ